MDKFINYREMMEYLFDDAKEAEKAGLIAQGMIRAQSPRITEVSAKMEGASESNQKMIYRFLKKTDLKGTLMRLYDEGAEFILGDPTEMERYKAPKTRYVGTLKDGETPGYLLMVLATPFRGRAIPFHFITYSSRTINDQATSRNQEHFRAFGEIKTLIGERPLVLDREFSYAELMEVLLQEKINFVIRLNLGNHPPRFFDEKGHPIKLLVKPGGTTIHRHVFYLGKIPVHLIGYWRKGLSNPIWIMTNLDPEYGREVYQARMKVEMTFKDCKDRLRLTRVMNKTQQNMEKIICLALIAYTVGVLFGEAVRDVAYGHANPDQIPDLLFGDLPNDITSGYKWQLYSGFFILTRQKLNLPEDTLSAIARAVTLVFSKLVSGYVPSFVPT
jgi:hypothetical protein